jgi:hypothetical protein
VGRFDTELRRLIDLRRAKDKAAEAEKRTKAAYKAYQAELHERIQEETGLTSFTAELGPGYGKVAFQIRSTIYGTVEDYDQLAEQLKAEGHEELLKPTIREGAWNEEVRERLENKQPIPAGGGFRTTDYISMSFKKS